MRIAVILALFGLSIVAIAEGAFLFRLSGQLSDLKGQLGGFRPNERGLPESPPDRPSSRESGNSPGTAPSPRPLPARLLGSAAPDLMVPAPADVPSAVALHEALATPEGRKQLRGAMGILKEEDRQARLESKAPKEEEKEQRMRDKVLATVAMAPHERAQMTDLFTHLQAGRRQIIEDMKSGTKDSGQARKEIDDLRKSTEKNVQTLMGDERAKQFREAEKRERQQGKGAGPQDRPPQPVTK